MELKDYFAEYCVNITKWCKKHRINRVTIHNVMRGMKPTYEVAMKIYKATNQEVLLFQA
jgi:hypothetical protein